MPFAPAADCAATNGEPMAELILVVDDEPVQRRLIEATLSKLGYEVLCADGGQAAVDILTGPEYSKISAVILDLVMPDVDGMAVLEAMSRKKKRKPVIVQTAQGGVETAVNAMRAGAIDFVVKPAAPQRLKVSLQNALKMGALEVEIKRISKSASGNLTINEIISASPNMETVKAIAAKAAQSNIPVLIEGESGVGKELVARAIQGMSERKSHNFVTVNCGALPENLAESILFGHEKGAFTGAGEKHRGKFQEADGGTLFLDEIGELPLEIQVKLLRAIQEGEVDPVGASKPVKVDIRLISATNRDLLSEVKSGNFREDLYYRLNVFPMAIPPLRERTEDIPELVRHFMARIAAEEGRSHIKSISSDAIDILCRYDWPGNIRQLENAIFRAVVLCETEELTLDDFPQIMLEENGKALQDDNAGKTTGDNCKATANAPAEPLCSSHGDSVLHLSDKNGEIISLETAECRIISHAIEKYDGRMSEIARKLGIGRSTLYRKLRDYGLEETENQQPEVTDN